MGNMVGRGNGNAASDTVDRIDEFSALPLIQQVKHSLRKHSRVNVWWPKDKRAYSGKILNFEDKSTTDGQRSTIVTVLYDDKSVRQYPLDDIFYKRVAIGQLRLSPDFAIKVMNQGLRLESAQELQSLRDSTLANERNRLKNGKTSINESTDVQDVTKDRWPAGYRPPKPKNPVLFVGKYVKVWWTLDDRAYGGTIKGMSRGKVDILYDDGTRKTYTRSRIETRISLGELPIDLARSVIDGTLNLAEAQVIAESEESSGKKNARKRVGQPPGFEKLPADLKLVVMAGDLTLDQALILANSTDVPTRDLAPTTITVMGVQTHDAKVESRTESIKNKERTLQDYRVMKMPADGHCMFHAVAFFVHGDKKMHMAVRKKVVQQMRKRSEFFTQFFPCPCHQDFPKDLDEDEENKWSFQAHLKDMVCSEDAWGSETELAAIAEVYKRPVWMVERRGRNSQYRLTKQFNPTGAPDDRAMVLLYGALTSNSSDQNHYDALVRKKISELTKDDI